MNFLTHNELAQFSLGASLLGSGGGGDSSILYGLLHYLLKVKGPVKILKNQDLPPSALVVPVALVGAPLISLERIPNTAMFLALLARLTQDHPGREMVLMPAEIGGCNALSPFILATQTGLPVLDGDLIGRAFPKINMCKPAVLGKKCQNTYLSSAYGECEKIQAESTLELEEKVRCLSVNYGGSAAIAAFHFEAEEQASYLIPGSITRAMQLGARLQQYAGNPRVFAESNQANYIGSGMVTEVSHNLENGFLIGYAKIKTENRNLSVFFQNEYLLIQAHDKEIFAESPEIIALIETTSGLPIASESLSYGLQLDLFSFEAPSFWKETANRQHVDLKAFNLLNL